MHIVRFFVLGCFYVAISYTFVAWKYAAYFKVPEALRPLLVFMHFFVVVSNIVGFIAFILLDMRKPPTAAISWTGLAIAILGVALLLWSIFTLGAATFIPPPNGKLITTGPFKITAHPIYFGGAMAAFGLAVWSASLLALAYALVITLMLIIVSQVEEKGLVEEFGNSYLNYKERTWLSRCLRRFT